MKRFVLLSLLVVLLSSSICFAESITQELSVDDFSLHGGITFGMTREDVRKAESNNGFEANDKSLTYTYYDSDGKYRSAECDGLYVYGSMAGISGSKLYYYFDDEGKLFAAVYEFGNHDMNSFNDIDELVVKKYSSIKANDTRTMPSILDVYYSNITRASFGSDTYKSLQFELSDGSRIQIEHAIFYSDVPGYSKEMNIMFGGHHYLEYQFTSAEELDEISIALREKQKNEEEQRQKEEEERERQRNNDI